MSQRIANSGLNDWSADRLPDLTGKTYLITGGNAGLGLASGHMLAKAGADIIIAARDPAKADAALTELAGAGAGKVRAITLDLADLASVRAAAKGLLAAKTPLDGLILNAGIMQTPQRQTADGFELQLGTNHLGHFLLAGLLLPLVETAAGRIVVVSSIAHRFGQMQFDDLMLTKNYSPSRAYGQSKLANLLFAFELHRRLQAAKSAVRVIAAHPGYSATNLQSTGPTGFLKGFYPILNALVAQPATRGALPIVLAAAGTEALPGAYYGPVGFGEMRGPVGDAEVTDTALNQDDAARLWQVSEELTGFTLAIAQSG